MSLRAKGEAVSSLALEIASGYALAMTCQGVAYGAGGVGGVPPLLSPRHTPGMKPDEKGFIGGEQLQ
jgi:hypothetical protein